MEFVAFVPVLLVLLAVLYFAARGIVDLEIRSVEKELDKSETESEGADGTSAPMLTVDRR